MTNRKSEQNEPRHEKIDRTSVKLMSHLRKLKNDIVNKVEKWQKLTAGLNPNHMHFFKPWKNDVQNCIKISMKLHIKLRLQGTLCQYTFIQSEVRKWRSSQSGKGTKLIQGLFSNCMHISRPRRKHVQSFKTIVRNLYEVDVAPAKIKKRHS